MPRSSRTSTGSPAAPGRWQARNRTYHTLLAGMARFHIVPRASVLEIGSGSGDLLTALGPSRGVGVDVSPRMVDLARVRHPRLELRVAAGEELDLDETFDYVVLSGLAPCLHDHLALFARVAAHHDPPLKSAVNDLPDTISCSS